jgi:hypothetical protein
VGYICYQLKDSMRNGNRDIAAILKHVAMDSLVKWTRNAGSGRMPDGSLRSEPSWRWSLLRPSGHV